MNKKPLIAAIIFIALILVFIRTGNKQAPSAYEGILPCADCPGLDTTITFYPDQTYTMKLIYQERNDNKPFFEKGTWKMTTGMKDSPNATIYQITPTKSTSSQYYLVLDKTHIQQLDMQKEKITGASLNFTLTQISQ